MTRTTIDIDPSVLKEAKALAQKRRATLGETISLLLAEALADAGKPKEPPEFRWFSKDMGPSLVDLEDKDAVWAILDQEWDPDHRS
ncbi:antitoxin [bacterium]|jgi:hypothetical protein|nr:antitoxin [bacterium]